MMCQITHIHIIQSLQYSFLVPLADIVIEVSVKLNRNATIHLTFFKKN